MLLSKQNNLTAERQKYGGQYQKDDEREERVTHKSGSNLAQLKQLNKDITRAIRHIQTYNSEMIAKNNSRE